MAHVHIFLSTVSAEFRRYRDALRHDLDRPNVTVKVQEDFIVTGTETLDLLDGYIRECDAVIHLVGDMTGAEAQAPSVECIRERYPDFAVRLPPTAGFIEPGAPSLSYTQWEAWLALYHRKVLTSPRRRTARRGTKGTSSTRSSRLRSGSIWRAWRRWSVIRASVSPTPTGSPWACCARSCTTSSPGPGQWSGPAICRI